jgi:hypothetical protein
MRLQYLRIAGPDRRGYYRGVYGKTRKKLIPPGNGFGKASQVKVSFVLLFV